MEEFPVSKSIAGVSMRLKPGGIRELHWHAIAAEWAFVVKGKVLTTVIAPNGQAATDVFDEGDIWYFPRGHGHALQNISNDEAHFVLGFDDGHFSEFGTFSITDWVARTPANVVQRNLGLSADIVKGLPTKELYILPGKIPQTIPEAYLAGDLETPQSAHKFRLRQMPAMTFPGGWERIVTMKEFPVNNTLTSVLQYLEPGAIREMHWHPNADEWQYILKGQSRVTIFGAHGRVKTAEFKQGQICFIERGFGHCVEQIGERTDGVFRAVQQPHLRGNFHLEVDGGKSRFAARRQFPDSPRSCREVAEQNAGYYPLICKPAGNSICEFPAALLAKKKNYRPLEIPLDVFHQHHEAEIHVQGHVAMK